MLNNENDICVLFSVVYLSEVNQKAFKKLYDEQKHHILKAPGSSHNHQAWNGGYVNHIADCCYMARKLYPVYNKDFHALNFTLEDVITVLLLHDIEKPFISRPITKEGRSAVRKDIIKKYGFELTESQKNALKYIEGEGKDYSSEKRVMNELAAFCHICDISSARIYHSINMI